MISDLNIDKSTIKKNTITLITAHQSLDLFATWFWGDFLKIPW